MAFTITVTWDEAQRCWHTGSSAEGFRKDDQFGRFEAAEEYGGDYDDVLSLPDRLIAAPVFDHGSLLWCETYLEALVLLKVHREAGHTAHLLWDMAEMNDRGDLWGHCVLTSWDLNDRRDEKTAGEGATSKQ